MKDLVIIGAGSVGGHVAANFSEFKLQNHRLIGFLDDDKSKHGQNFVGYPVLGNLDLLFSMDQVAVVIGIAFPNIKKKIYERINSHSGLTYPNLISQFAWVSNHCKIGVGNIIYPGSCINYGSVLEDFVVINFNCSIGHDAYIGSYSSLAPGVNFAGHTCLSELVQMGIGSSTIQGVQLGKGAIVGGQAMVLNNITQNTTVVGVPAKGKQFQYESISQIVESKL